MYTKEKIEIFQKQIKNHQYIIEVENGILQKETNPIWHMPLFAYFIARKRNQKMVQNEQKIEYDKALRNLFQRHPDKTEKLSLQELKQVLELITFYLQNQKMCIFLEEQSRLSDYLFEQGYDENLIALFYETKIEVQSKKIRVYH